MQTLQCLRKSSLTWPTFATDIAKPLKLQMIAIGVAKGNSSLRDFLNIALYEIQIAGKHNEIWESFWGMPPLVKIEADPYF